MAGVREKFATQMESVMLAELRQLSRSEGRELQSLLEEAVGQMLEQRRGGTARPHVVAAYLSSVERYGPVYQNMAANNG